jgi:twitching motility protein PilT
MNYKETIEKLMDTVIKEGGSDLHLSAGSHPVIRVDDALIPLQTSSELKDEDTVGFLKAITNDTQYENFKEEQELDFSYHFKEKARFRGNAFIQQGKTSIALRFIPGVVKTFKDLNLPEILSTFTAQKQGFFLVVGPVGQGKTTTLASMVELINKERSEHIMTIEDPIEYMFENKKSIINQREVNVDTKSFNAGLMSAFREDVDVIMLGEMRDLDTISAAVTAAETGHLVFSTLHTNDAAQTIDRIIDSFPPAQQGQIRLQLSSSLTGIFSQRLVPRIAGGLIPAYELLIKNSAVSNLIREARTHEIQTVIETSSEAGMIDMNRSLADLVKRGEVNPDEAFAFAVDKKALERLL